MFLIFNIRYRLPADCVSEDPDERSFIQCWLTGVPYFYYLKYSPFVRPLEWVCWFMLGGIEVEVYGFSTVNSLVSSLIIFFNECIYSLIKLQAVACRI